jgi:WD40 repeat protein
MHRLLRETFAAPELRRFCRLSPRFQFLDDHFGPGFSKLDMIDTVLRECEDRDLLPALLAEVEAYEPPPLDEDLPAIPAPFTVPFPRNDRFVGREEELEALHRLLSGDGKAVPVGITPAGISGMGGIGKTQLAVEHAHRHRDDYPGGVFWVNAARVEDWAQELVDLADRAGLVQRDPASPDRTGQMVAALARYLQGNLRSLVIFDNVADPGHLQTVRLGPGITPVELGGAQLFTTRRRNLPHGLATLDVEILPRDASRQMILAARPEAAEDSALEQLCVALGDLPLALELAAAALRRRPRLSPTAYLENLGRLGADVVHDKARVTPDDLATYYAASLTPALQAQWDALQDKNACLLLRAAAQLGEAELLPVARLGLLTGLRDDDGLEEPLSDALRELEANSLIESIQSNEARAGRRLRLHPLVRDFAARQTLEAEIPAFRQGLAANLAAAYGEITTLEAHCARRGIDALQHDLITALGLLDQTSKVSEDLRSLEADLHELLRLLQREAHNLRGWDPDEYPAFLAQQVAKRATELGLAGLAGAAEAHLDRGTTPYLWLQWRAGGDSPALERTLVGHESEVRAVTLTPNGHQAVSASDDGTLRVWDLVSGEEVAILHGHSGPVRAVTVTPDGRQAVSASDDRMLRIWNLDTGAMMASLRGHDDWVLAVAVTPDGQRAVSGSADGTLRVWDLESGEELATLRGHEGGVNAVAVTPDGRRAVSVSTDRTLRLWDLESGQELALRGHGGYVYGVAVLPDGYRAVSGSSDQVLKVWDLESGQLLATTHRHEGGVNAVTVTPDGQRALSASADGTVRVWDLDSGQQLAVLRGHEDVVRSVAVTPDGRRAVSASSDRTLRVWDLDLIGEQEALRSHAGAVSAIVVTPGGTRAVSASSDRVLKVWDIDSGQEMAVLRGHEDGVLAVAVVPDGHRVVSASTDRSLRIWDLSSGKELVTLRGHEGGEGGVLGVAVTPDGRRAVSASSDQTLKVWDLDSGIVLVTLLGHDDWVRTVAVIPPGRRAVSGSDDGTLRVWDLASGAELATLRGHRAWVSAVAVTPNGRQAVSASYDGTLRVWALSMQQFGVELATLAGHTADVYDVAVMLDEHHAVSASADGTLRVWDLEKAKELAALALDRRLECVAVVPSDAAVAGTVMFMAGDAAGNVYCLRYVEPGRDR